MGHFDIKHNEKQYTITEESYIVDEKTPYTDVNITADHRGRVYMAPESPDEFKGQFLRRFHRRCFLQGSIASAFYGRT
ncbi:MAG: hypothetical protein WDM78_12430 [Puia sp.]